MRFDLQTGTYKSLQGPITWDSIPEFAVITGLNGSGKTQLLELIQHHYSIPKHREARLRDLVLKVTGPSYQDHEVVMVPGLWSLKSPGQITQHAVDQARDQLWGELKTPQRKDPYRQKYARDLLSELDLDLSAAAPPDLDSRLPLDYMIDRRGRLDQLPQQIGLLFRNYLARKADLLLDGVPEERLVAELPVPPWEVFNELLSASALPYQVTWPKGIQRTFTLELTDIFNGTRVPFSGLSSGERAIFALGMWAYSSSEFGAIPRLLLLDEPDCHLHTSQVSGFLRLIKETFVDRYGCRVIMTTHRPDTIALVDESCLFEMSRLPPRIRPVTSRSEAIARLTGNLVSVVPGTRSVLVEDAEDAAFYEDVVRALVLAQCPLAGATLVFFPASLGTGSKKVAGGSKQVLGWVRKLRAAELETVHGLIDRDRSNQPEPGVHVIQRHSHENYLYDPLTVFCALLDGGKAPSIPEITLGPGDEHKVSELAESELQRLVDAVMAPVGVRLGAQNAGEASVEYTNGKTIQLPTWAIDTRGHDLANAFRSEYGPRTVGTTVLRRFMLRLRMIPKCLRESLETISSAP